MAVKPSPKAGCDPVPSDLLIPPYAGAQKVTGRYQRRTQLQYTFLVALGLLGFYKCEEPRVRVAALSCLFPGAGFVAVGGFLGIIGLTLSLAVVPLSLFAWFGAGGLAFVLANWIVPGLVATLVVGANRVWEPAAPIALTVVVTLSSYAIISGRRRYAEARRVRDSRNTLLVEEDEEWRERAESLPDPEDKRELSMQELRMLQHFVEVAHQAADDWSNYTVIDQFQTSALRYQLYFLQYTLAVVQKYHMPNFHGYIKTGQERIIDRSTTKDVMNYWKWESLWGKFTLDWDPVVRDNIMVTGYILLCVSLYEKLNGDDRYRQKSALNFRITDRAKYYHNAQSVFDALMQNWESCAYCLYPCEPNWIYSMCNLIGMQGALAYDSYMKTGRAAPLIQGPFHRGLEEDFMNADGSIVALRSAITGFPVIGLVGVVGDVGGALNLTAGMPDVARRLWLVSRERVVRKTKSGKHTLENLVGADKMDVGNYKAGGGYSRCAYASCAVEFGETELARDLVAEVDEELHPLVEVPGKTGAITSSGLSLLATTSLFRARIGRRNDWANLVTCDVDQRALAAPKLDSVPFPEVMVARCHAVDGSAGLGVEFVLRGPSTPKSVTISFCDLQAGIEYHLVAAHDGQWQKVVSGIRADDNGCAYMQVAVGDRTELALRVSA